MQPTPFGVSRTRPPQRFRRFGFALLTVLAAAVLSACGAEVNAQLELQSDYSGERRFIITMAEADTDALKGGIQAAERALASHTPDTLKFEGVQEEEDGFSARFTLGFNDLEEYQHKLHQLLDASDVPDTDRGMFVAVDEQALVTSITVEEDFYNDDLMGWAAQALIEENVVSAQSTIFTAGGATAISFNDEVITNSTSLPRVYFSMHEDRRFDEVKLDLAIEETGDIQVAMSYRIDGVHHAAQNHLLDEQLATLEQLEGLAGPITDSGAVIPDPATSTAQRDLQMTFTSPEAVTAGMQVLLVNDQTSFAVHETTEADTPQVSAQYIGSNWTCEAICDPTNLHQLAGDITYPEHWDATTQHRHDGELLLEFNRGLPVDAITATTSLDFSGTLTQTFEFVVQNQAQAGHEETVRELFAPPQDIGSSLSTSTRGPHTIYMASFTSQDAQELTDRLNAYFAAKDITTPASIALGSFSGLWPTYDLTVDVSPLWELATGSVSESARFEVLLPALHRATPSEQLTKTDDILVIEDSSGAFSLTASGPTPTTGWTVVIGFLVVAALLFVVMRRQQAARPVGQDSASAGATAHDTPYNIQRPGDALTTSELYAAPLASTPHQAHTTKLPNSVGPRVDTSTPEPFPELPLPEQPDFGAEQVGDAPDLEDPAPYDATPTTQTPRGAQPPEDASGPPVSA